MTDRLTFNYHDAILESILLRQNKLELTISLYNILYPAQRQVKLVIENITNIITCEKWITEINTAYREENEVVLGARIDAIYLDQKHSNKLLISVDAIKTLKINFTQISETHIEN